MNCAFIHCLGVLVLVVSAGARAQATPQKVRVVDEAPVKSSATHVWVSDLASDSGGTHIEAVSSLPLPAGEHTLYLSLALEPTDDPRLADLQVRISVGRSQFTFDAFDFDGGGRFTRFVLPFVCDSGPVAICIWWECGPVSNFTRNKLAAKPSLKPKSIRLDREHADVHLDLEAELDVDHRPDGRVDLAHARQTSLRLMLNDAVIVRQPAIAIISIDTDKITYRPDESGEIVAVIRNGGDRSVEGVLALTTTSELADTHILLTQKVKLGPGEARTVRASFKAAGQFGREICGELKVGGQSHSRRAYFSVSSDVWDVGIGYNAKHLGHTGLNLYKHIPDNMRAVYANLVERFFWAPDDWCRMAPESERWWSGQASYPETDAGLREMIDQCHQQGMRVVSYAKACAGGPYGWELAREHPDWFERNRTGGIVGWYDVRHLDHWNDSAFRDTLNGAQLPWYKVVPDSRKVEVLELGAKQIVQSVQRYGWDAMRFDGHYTVAGDDAHSTWNMQQLKRLVWGESPDTAFGFNYGYTPRYHGGMTDEMREALAGGGMYLNEAFGQWHHTVNKYTSWRHLAENESAVGDAIRQQGGHYYCILGQPDGEPSSPHPPQAYYYKLVLSLIAGAHSLYSGWEQLRGCGVSGWGAFMTRWSAMLWDRQLVRLDDERVRIQTSGNTTGVETFIRRRVIDATRAVTVVHLLTMPKSDEITKTSAPASPRSAAIQLKLEANESLIRAAAIMPSRGCAPVELPVTSSDSAIEMSVDDPARWTMVLIETEGEYDRRALPVSYSPRLQAQRSPGGGASGVVVDPLKQTPAVSEPESNGMMVRFNQGSAGVACHITTDPDDGQAVQWRPYKQADAMVGKSWIGPFEPGRYEITFRIKYTDPTGTRVPQSIDLPLKDETDDALVGRLTLYTPGHPDAPKDSSFLRSAGEYHEYRLGIVNKSYFGHLHLLGYANTKLSGRHSIYLDNMRARPIELYSDRQLIEWGSAHLINKPSALREPSGAAPQRVMLVKGMFWRPFLRGVSFSIDSRYDLPSDYDSLYRYDTIVLCNVDLSWVPFPKRKLLADFVNDGGRLVVLGGPFTLGNGGVVRTFVDEVLPVECRPDEVVACELPTYLAYSNGESFGADARVLWMHDVRPREGSKVLLRAGDRPALVVGHFGRGMTYVFTPTSQGESADAFWKSDRWPMLFERIVRGKSGTF